MNSKINQTIFYHIYPLGLFDCPRRNDFCQNPGDGLKKLTEFLPQIKNTGANAIYIGPLFESTAHGYDTLDYFWVDRRLGTNDDFIKFVEAAHGLEMKVVLDAVFNHTGRDFFAFKDLQKNGWESPYKDWYENVNFGQRNWFGDNFTYNNWAGCDDLVKLNLANPQVQDYLFGAVKKWICDFHIDGLRLDAADVLSFDFMKKLRSFCCSLDSDFWLMGEVVHGDYNQWVNDEVLNSVTNYQLHKALWSSFKDKNFFEVAYSLNQMFGNGGKYVGKFLYNFLDNHDVNRVASNLNNQNHLLPLYGLLFTVPGIPSIYYGSELGVRGVRGAYDDYELRPSLPPFSSMPDFAKPWTDSNALLDGIKKIAKIRKENMALQMGNYEQIFVSNILFVFLREFFDSKTLVLINCDENSTEYIFQNIPCGFGKFRDLINGKEININTGTKINLNGCEIKILARI